MSNKLPDVAILCGGRGSRLSPLTDHTPKSMIEIAGRPFLEHQLEELHRQGITRVVLCVGYLAQEIIPFVSDWEAR